MYQVFVFFYKFDMILAVSTFEAERIFVKQGIRIGLLDSGAGGLTVLAEVMKAIPQAEYFYLCDNFYFPYGEKGSKPLLQRILCLCEAFVSQTKADLLVVPCNTASALSLTYLRKTLSIPIVGVVPAIKTAVETTQTNHIGVVATKGTIQSAYLAELIENVGNGCRITKVSSPGLVELSELKLSGQPVSLKDLAHELLPFFKDSRIDRVVLGCTHYSHLMDELREIQPRDLVWVDSCVAIARRVSFLLKEQLMLTQDSYTLPIHSLKIFYTEKDSFSEKQKKTWKINYPIHSFELFSP